MLARAGRGPRAGKALAEQLNLEIGGGGFAFHGNWGTKGLYAYSGNQGASAGRAYFGTGGTPAQMCAPVAGADRYRPWDRDDVQRMPAAVHAGGAVHERAPAGGERAADEGRGVAQRVRHLVARVLVVRHVLLPVR